MRCAFAVIGLAAVLAMVGCGTGSSSVPGNGTVTWGMSPAQVEEALGTPLLPDIFDSPLGSYTLAFNEVEPPGRTGQSRWEAYFFQDGQLLAVREERMYRGAIKESLDELTAKFGKPTSEGAATAVQSTKHWTRKDRSGVRLQVAQVGQIEIARIVYHSATADLTVVEGEDAAIRRRDAVEEAMHQSLMARARDLEPLRGTANAFREALVEFGVDSSSPVAERLRQDLGVDKK